MEAARQRLTAAGLTVHSIVVRDLDPADLVYGRYDGASIRPCIDQIAGARGLIIATPVYRAAYAGVLKAFFDILPANVLAGKVVLPIASGGALNHALVIDYALNPVLSALGAERILRGLYLLDGQFEHTRGYDLRFTGPEIEAQFQKALDTFIAAVKE
jgi:FMN reductase